MIVEIMQSHVDSGKWYLQHQPTHPRADALLAAIRDSRKSAQLSDLMRISRRRTRYRGLPIPLLDTTCATGDGSTTTSKARSQDAGSNSTRHDSRGGTG